MGPAGPQGLAGAPGEKGERGEKGEAGDDGMALRLVRGEGPSATCAAGEVLVSAFCTGRYTRYPLTTTGIGAKCGPDVKSNAVTATIVCGKF